MFAKVRNNLQTAKINGNLAVTYHVVFVTYIVVRVTMHPTNVTIHPTNVTIHPTNVTTPYELTTKRKKEVLKGCFYLVHDACTNRTWALYETYIDIIRMVHRHCTK
ncbi:MAG: hypothetical protein IKH63_10375 [Prevotella sp.]|nr:hypothetical protein [Prevotella sp.]